MRLTLVGGYAGPGAVSERRVEVMLEAPSPTSLLRGAPLAARFSAEELAERAPATARVFRRRGRFVLEVATVLPDGLRLELAVRTALVPRSARALTELTGDLVLRDPSGRREAWTAVLRVDLFHGFFA